MSQELNMELEEKTNSEDVPSHKIARSFRKRAVSAHIMSSKYEFDNANKDNHGESIDSIENIEYYEKKMEEYEIKISELNEQLSLFLTTKNDLENSKNRIEILECEILNYKSQIKTLTTANNALQDENKLYIEQINDLNEKMNEMKHDLTQTRQRYRETLQFQEKYFQNNNNTNNNTNKNNKNNNNSHNHHNPFHFFRKNQNNNNNNNNSDNDAKSVESMNEHNNFGASLSMSSIQRENIDLKESNEKLMSKMESEQSEINKLKKLIKKYETELKGKELIIEDMTNELHLSQNNIEKLIDENENLKENIQSSNNIHNHNGLLMMARGSKSGKMEADDGNGVLRLKMRQSEDSPGQHHIGTGRGTSPTTTLTLDEIFLVNDSKFELTNDLANDLIEEMSNVNIDEANSFATESVIESVKKQKQNQDTPDNNENKNDKDFWDTADKYLSQFESIMEEFSNIISKQELIHENENNEHLMIIEKFRNMIFEGKKKQALLEERLKNSEKELTTLRKKNNILQSNYKKFQIESDKKMKLLCLDIYNREYKKYDGFRQICQEYRQEVLKHALHRFLPWWYE